MSQPRLTMRSFWRRRARPVPAVVDIDPADMGTCYGLELSLALPHPTAEAALSAAETAPWWERAGARKTFGA